MKKWKSDFKSKKLFQIKTAFDVMAKSQMIKRVHQNNDRKRSFFWANKTGDHLEPEDIASGSKWPPPSPPLVSKLECQNFWFKKNGLT